ncbi:hypothetical protein CCACVL1_17820 [Corchorus capsularis]|uniref:Uncharacterized protein n=1 Tax=Corchorus capsularis TaxID=210143 RepID=A0A1R3HQJ1_COCAP|nr:hypothetical protein CCACVL1_17820 [Corchorus capsularis]
MARRYLGYTFEYPTVAGILDFG